MLQNEFDAGKPFTTYEAKIKSRPWSIVKPKMNTEELEIAALGIYFFKLPVKTRVPSNSSPENSPGEPPPAFFPVFLGWYFKFFLFQFFSFQDFFISSTMTDEK